MATLPIVKHPNACLRQPCAEIREITDSVRRLADDMVETMLAANGIGLAAPQVGQTVRLLVADVSETRTQPLRLANPRILERSGDFTMEEGCLSVPGVRAPVKRAHTVRVSGIGMDGEEKIIDASELLAVCLQHEIDHLDGILFFDRLSAFRRARLLSKYKKQNTA